MSTQGPKALKHAADLAGRLDAPVIAATQEVDSLESAMASPLPNLRKYGFKVNNPSYVEVFRGWNTSDPSYRATMDELVSVLEANFPVQRGASWDGVNTDWSELRSVQSVLANPAGTPPTNSWPYRLRLAAKASPLKNLSAEAARKQYLATQKISERDDAIVARFYDVVCETAGTYGDWPNVPINRASNCGLGEMTSDIGVKATIMQDWDERAELRAKLIADQKVDALLAEGLVPAYVGGFRTQLEGSVFKDGKLTTAKYREVFDHNGEWKEIDRTLPRWEQKRKDLLPDRFLSCRPRQISQMPMAFLLPLRAVAIYLMTHLKKVWPETFDIRDEVALLAKLAAKERFSAISIWDVKSQDQTTPSEYTAHACRNLKFAGNYVPAYAMAAFRMPQISRNDYRSGRGLHVPRFPASMASFNAVYETPSGVPFTSFVSKVNGALTAYLALVYAGVEDGSSLSIRRFLRGKGKVSCWILGDNVFAFSHDARYDSVVRDLNEHSPYQTLEASDTFAGLVFQMGETGEMPRFLRNPATFVGKLLCPDRTLGHPQRGDWSLALPERRALFFSNPVNRLIEAAVDSVLVKHTGVGLDARAEEERKEAKPAPVRLLNAADEEFYRNRDAIHYKIDASELSQEVYDHYFITWPQARVTRVMKHFRG